MKTGEHPISGPHHSPHEGMRKSPLRTPHLVLLLVGLAVFFSLPALRGSGRDMDYAGNFFSFLTRFFPPDFSIWPDISGALLETAQIAVMATLFSALLSLPVAVAASKTLSPPWLVVMARAVLSVVRSIPGLIWALLAVVVIGANSLAGVVALTFYSLGYLGKFFSDAMESADTSVAEALRAAGADRIQGFQFGVWPHARPLIWSHVLWMLEYNIRSAAIIGYVGAGGIGVWLHTYQEYGQWNRFATVMLCILILVLILDWLGVRLRSAHARRMGGQ